MFRLALVFVFTLFAADASCQQASFDVHGAYGRRSTWELFADYSNDSSHIILGQAGSRKLAGIGVGWSRRLKATRFAEWDYEAEIRPLYFLRDPTATGNSTVAYFNLPPGGGILDGPAGGSFDGAAEAACQSGTYFIHGTTPSGLQYLQTVTQQCGTRWSYVGGVSPLGQRVNFAPRRRLQPYLVANGGFLAATHDEPIDQTESFNFTFEGGAGLEYFGGEGKSWALDFRVHHLSNGYRGIQNPGIDSGMVRVEYRFGR